MAGAMSFRKATTVMSAGLRLDAMLSTISELPGTPRSVIRMAPAAGLLAK